VELPNRLRNALKIEGIKTVGEAAISLMLIYAVFKTSVMAFLNCSEHCSGHRALNETVKGYASERLISNAANLYSSPTDISFGA
jgi:hypothetical protein